MIQKFEFKETKLKGAYEITPFFASDERGGLIKRVTVKRRVDKYDFYESFRKAALLYYDYYTDKCDFAEFYSYMPQYSQLKDAQRSYYFYWRYMLRHGKYIRTDYSYVYLYVYEILNLPDKIPPEEGIRLLCSLWREYRKSLPRLDNYFSIWVQDYCLVHRLPCPEKELGEFLPKCIASADFKEFYLSDIKNAGEGGVLAMLAFLSDYDWTRGKFVSGKPREDERGFNIAVSSSEDYKNAVRKTKREWLNKYEFPYDVFHGIQYGTTKANCVRSALAPNETAILVDDNAQVRKGWTLGETIDPTAVDLIEVLKALL